MNSGFGQYFVVEEGAVAEHTTRFGRLREKVLDDAEERFLNNKTLGVRNGFKVLDKLVSEVVFKDLEGVFGARRHLSLNLL
jgi:hypothetical protein